MSEAHPHHGQPVKMAGSPLGEATSAVIMLHGRGATADDILGFADELRSDRVIFVAPQAAGNTWYPFSFLVPTEQNEPFLSSALMTISDNLKLLQEAAIPADRTVLLGFSQGACLALEYMARNARRYAGVAGLSGGLIGPVGTVREYAGSFDGTPVFLGCSESDPHIPSARVTETGKVLAAMGAEVTVRLYPRLGHTVNRSEIAEVQKILNTLAQP